MEQNKLAIGIVFGTSEGQTRKVAETLGSHLRSLGHQVQVIDVNEAEREAELESFDGILIGASIHVGSYSKKIREYVTAHRGILDERPSGFFSVSLTASEEGEEAEATVRGYLEALIEETGWMPDGVASFAGALPFTRYGFFKRMLMKKISADRGQVLDTKRDYEFTDWEDVRAFAERFAQMVEELRGKKWDRPLGSVPTGPGS